MPRHPELATLTQPPAGELIVPYDLIHTSLLAIGNTDAEIGVARMEQRVLETDENGVAYVDMNTAGRLALSGGSEGLIATSSLAGCTGVAGFAKTDGGSLQFVSHFDPRSEAIIIDRVYFEPLQAIGSGKCIIPPRPSHWVVPSPYNLSQFYTWAAKENATEVNMVVAYGGKKEDFYRMGGLGNYTLHHGDVGEPTEDNKPVKSIYMLPYDNDRGHYLAAGRHNGQEGIFWDGVKIDFEPLGRYDITSELARAALSSREQL